MTPVYDADGNLTDDGRWLYTWDAQNRLIRMETTTAATTAGHPYTKLTFRYDWQGRRLERAVWKGGIAASPTFSSRRRWLYDGWNPIAEFDSNEEGTTNTRLKTFTWGLDLTGTLQGAGGVGGLIVQTDVSGSVKRRASYDGNGNIVAWTRSNQSGPDYRCEYDAFGNTLVSEGTSPSEYGFSTKQQDAETGLYYYGYRYYDAVHGRWLNRDPIEEEGGINLYGFVENNGISNFDFLGKYNLNPDNGNGPSGADLAKLNSSLKRVLKKTEKLTKAIDNMKVCLDLNKPASNSAIDKITALRDVYEKIGNAIAETKELEVEQNDLGPTVKGIMSLFSIPLDPILNLNVNPSNDWKSMSNDDLDSLLMHEISHEAAGTEDNSALDATDAHFVDDLNTPLCDDLVIKSWMPLNVRNCCCPKIK